MFGWKFQKGEIHTGLARLFVCFWLNNPQWATASSFTRFLDHTLHTTVGTTPLDEWSARRRDLYLTTHNIHNIHASGGIRTRSPSKREAADPRLRPRGQWHRQALSWPYNKPNHISFRDICKTHFNVFLHGICSPEVSHQNAVCPSVATTHTVRRLTR